MPNPASRPMPTPREQAAIAAAEEWLDAEPPRAPEAALTPDGRVAAPHADDRGFTAQLQQAVSSRSPDFQAVTIERLARVARGAGIEPTAAELNAGLALVCAVAPRNEFEAAAAVQMAGVHTLACEMLARAGRDSPHHDAMAVRATRSFALMAESLARLRGLGWTPRAPRNPPPSPPAR